MGERRPLVRRIRSAAQTTAVGSLIALARWLPRPWLLGVGTAVGELAYRLDRKHTRVAIKNLTLAFGDALSPSERRRIAQDCWRHYGRITADAAAFHRLGRRDIGNGSDTGALELRAAHAEEGVL
jgi:lauroyl/myristoyl acyltransferase